MLGKIQSFCVIYMIFKYNTSLPTTFICDAIFGIINYIQWYIDMDFISHITYIHNKQRELIIIRLKIESEQNTKEPGGKYILKIDH